MIVYYRLWDKLRKSNIKRKDLSDKKIVSESTLNKLKNNQSVTTESIDKLCAYLNCQPEELLEYVPNPETETTNTQT